MRNSFAREIHSHMKNDSRIWFLSGGVGYKTLDSISMDYPDRFIDCEASEQAMMDIAIGLALEGKIPFVYSITPHMFRSFEAIRNYLWHENVPVKIVGIGRDKDYGSLGFSHWSEDDQKIYGLFPNIIQYRPESIEQIPSIINEIIINGSPSYLNLPR